MGLSFQQLHKYERGTNRISASRLRQLGIILRVHVAYFFEDISADGILECDPPHRAADDASDNLMSKKKTYELLRAFYGAERLLQMCQADSRAPLNVVKHPAL